MSTRPPHPAPPLRVPGVPWPLAPSTQGRTPAVRVLGIDPGTRLLGWGVVDSQGTQARAVAHGVLRMPASVPIEQRLARLASGLREVVQQWKPQEAALEEVFFGHDTRAAVRLGEARGAVMLVLAEAGLPVTGYANNVVKKAVGGAGRASKGRVQALVWRMLAVPDAPATADASDALALALCHVHRRAFAGGSGQGPDLAPRVLEAIARARAARRRK